MQSISVGKKDLSKLTMKEGDYSYYDTPMGKESLRQMAEKQSQTLVDNESSGAMLANKHHSALNLILQKEISVLAQGKNFHKSMEASLGLDAVFCKSSAERILRISIETGMPVLEETSKRTYREVTLYQPIVSYTMFKTEDGNARFICIGCTNKTVYMIVRKELAYSFVIDMSSLTTKEAVKNLYVSNLNKGPVVFQKTAKLLNGFFDRLFAATWQEPTILTFDAKHISGDTVVVKLYLDPITPANNMMSVNGWVYDVQLNEFPSKQINRGYNIKKKDGARNTSK